MWEVRLHSAVEDWFLDLCCSDPETADLVSEAIDVLADQGPALGRPLVDSARFAEHLAALKQEDKS